MGERLEQAIAVLNGLVGDYLAREHNGLATELGLYLGGVPVVPTGAGLARAYPEATPRAAVLVHGVMCTETIWRFPQGGDYGTGLRDELGVTPLYVRYNSGRPIADNGADLARLLQAVCDAYPGGLRELIPIGYSMGGLVVRSACHFAQAQRLPWLQRVQRAIYIGTPHLGAPAERVGRIAARVLRTIPDPYARLIGELGDLRSAGIKDLGDADLRHEDRASVTGRLSLGDPRHPVPLLPGIRHALVAGALSLNPRLAALFGDAIVPVRSATARQGGALEAPIPPERVRVIPERSHLELAHDPEVYAFIRAYCQP